MAKRGSDDMDIGIPCEELEEDLRYEITRRDDTAPPSFGTFVRLEGDGINRAAVFSGIVTGMVPGFLQEVSLRCNLYIFKLVPEPKHSRKTREEEEINQENRTAPNALGFAALTVGGTKKRRKKSKKRKTRNTFYFSKRNRGR